MMHMTMKMLMMEGITLINYICMHTIYCVYCILCMLYTMYIQVYNMHLYSNVYIVYSSI